MATRDSSARSKKRPLTRAYLRRKVHRHLLTMGFVKNCNGYVVEGEMSKQKVRDLHSVHRQDVLKSNREFVESHGKDLLTSFASGRSVDPTAIDPELVEVFAGSPEAHLFRFACLLWSVPVSRGFGRRLRFLVRDRQNGVFDWSIRHG